MACVDAGAVPHLAAVVAGGADKARELALGALVSLSVTLEACSALRECRAVPVLADLVYSAAPRLQLYAITALFNMCECVPRAPRAISGGVTGHVPPPPRRAAALNQPSLSGELLQCSACDAIFAALASPDALVRQYAAGLLLRLSSEPAPSAAIAAAGAHRALLAALRGPACVAQE